MLLLLLLSAKITQSFPISTNNRANIKSTWLQAVQDSGSTTSRGATEKSASKKGGYTEVSFLLEEFKTAQGNYVDPYKILKVKRTATKMEIKQSYRKLSRKLHPDMVMQRDILPGKWWVCCVCLFVRFFIMWL